MSKTNGRIIGPYQDVSVSTANGVHSSFDQYTYKLEVLWPYPPSVEISLSTSSLNETTNKDLVVTLNTTGYASGTQFTVTAENVSNFSSSDMNPYTGTITVSGDESSATGNTTLSVVQDQTDESPDTETFKVVVRGPSPATTVLAESGNVTISDTSTTAPSLSLSFYESAYGSDIDGISVYVVTFDAAGTSTTGSTEIYSRSGGNVGADWSQQTGSSYPSLSSGTKYRILFQHRKNNSGFRGDYAIDEVNISGTTYDFDSNATGWLTTTIHTGTLSTAWSNASQVPTTTGSVRGRWNRDTGTTPSSDTGPTSGFGGSGYFLYTEATSPNTTNPSWFWLFSPEFTA